MCEQGDILKGEKTIHPIVFLKEKDKTNFTGCILTHSNSKKYKNNIALEPKYFETQDEKGKQYEVSFDGTYFVNLNLLKKAEWGPFIKVGKLRNKGVEFIRKHLKETKPKEWRKYLGE